MNEQPSRYDPTRLVTCIVTRAMFFDTKRLEVGTQFEARADQVPYLEETKRCRIANDADRRLVYKIHVSWS